MSVHHQITISHLLSRAATSEVLTACCFYLRFYIFTFDIMHVFTFEYLRQHRVRKFIKIGENNNCVRTCIKHLCAFLSSCLQATHVLNHYIFTLHVNKITSACILLSMSTLLHTLTLHVLINCVRLTLYQN